MRLLGFLIQEAIILLYLRYCHSQVLLCQQSAGEVAHGVPHGQEAYGEDGDEDNDHVEGMDADGIGIDNERPLSQSDDSELLLNPA